MKGYVEDAELPDETDLEFQAEMFELFRMRGYKPEDLRDQDVANKYAAWLETAPPAEE